MTDQLFITIKEAQQMLRLGKTKIYELILAGELQAVKIGAARRVSLQSLRAFASRMMQECPPTAGPDLSIRHKRQRS